jgi:hypothetical protein
MILVQGIRAKHHLNTCANNNSSNSKYNTISKINKGSGTIEGRKVSVKRLLSLHR